MKRLGILGGTFDPIHNGHLVMAQIALETMKLDQVVFVPSNLPPHKKQKGIFAAADRFKMVKLATTGNSFFSVSDVEFIRPGKSYTIDTVKHFKKAYPKTLLFFITGSDSFSTISSWKNWQEILNFVQIIVVNRPGKYQFNKKIKHFTVSMPSMDVSSSLVRERIKKNKSVRYFVPDKVYEYIEQIRKSIM